MFRFRFRSRTALVLVAGLVATACASAGSDPAGDAFAEPAPDEVLLTVQNLDIRPATIYAYWNGMKERVGTAGGAKSTALRMRWRFEEVQLGYEFLGRRAVAGGTDYVDGFRSESISVTQGDHLNLVIQPQG